MEFLKTAFWLVALLFSGLLLVGVEILIPGGIVGAIGVLMVLGSIVLAFVDLGPAGGAAYTVVALVVSATAARVMVKGLLKSRLAGRVILRKELEESKSFSESGRELVGQEGEALTDLRPSGTARIAGRRVDVVTEGAFIGRGTLVKVTQVEGARVVVRSATVSPGSAC